MSEPTCKTLESEWLQQEIPTATCCRLDAYIDPGLWLSIPDKVCHAIVSNPFSCSSSVDKDSLPITEAFGVADGDDAGTNANK